METPAFVAAQRFGLGEPRLADGDPAAALHAQVGPPDAQRGDGLAGSADGLRAHAAFVQARRAAREGDAKGSEEAFAEHFRALVQADVRARLATAALTARPYAERLALFWSNHFTVSIAKAPVRGLAGAFEREAIRPHVAGRFADLLHAAVTHAAMLRYLDNEQSAGPDSRVVRVRGARLRERGETPRVTGLNENLAREVLELHTLGVSGGGAAYGGWGGYTQADVTAFAAVLTGWRTSAQDFAVHFDPAWHQPGPKTVLGRRYPEGPEALPQLLRDLARHPSTARFVSAKLARHFTADEPPPALVERLRRRFVDTDGDLGALAHALVDAPEPWQDTATKLKTPEEFVISSVRLLGLGDAPFERVADGGIGALGQRVQAAPSPAGWPDRADDWLGPDALWKRVEWATRLAERSGRTLDARALAASAFGPALGEATRRQVERAADGPQALALLLLSPEFQRR